MKCRVALLLEFVIIFLAVSCTSTPTPGSRPALPTAVPAGITSTPVTGAVGPTSTPPLWATPLPSLTPTWGPTSTPAPWATPIPTPLPRSILPPGIPHSVAGRDNCLYCHNTPASFGVPPDHAKRTNAMCLGCHALSPSAPQPRPPAIPHAISGRVACLVCHLMGTNGARHVPVDHTGRGNNTCQKCHHQEGGGTGKK